MRRDAFSADPQQMAKCGEAFLEGLESHGVLACGKHFPGSGSSRAASPAELPLVSKPMAELWREDLFPYRALLPRLPLILVSTAAYKAYDFDLLQSAGLSSKGCGEACSASNWDMRAWPSPMDSKRRPCEEL